MIVKFFGHLDYQQCFDDMKKRHQEIIESGETNPEIWIGSHPPVYTQGLAGKMHHLLSNDLNIPVVQTDRGGQLTYHGPGQLMVYLFINLKERKIRVNKLVRGIENTIIRALSFYGINSYAEMKAPGVYVNSRKIASIGLRVLRGVSYHGFAVNVDMDLKPFEYINPCGYVGLQMTDVKRESDSLVDGREFEDRMLSCVFDQLECWSSRCEE